MVLSSALLSVQPGFSALTEGASTQNAASAWSVVKQTVLSTWSQITSYWGDQGSENKVNDPKVEVVHKPKSVQPAPVAAVAPPVEIEDRTNEINSLKSEAQGVKPMRVAQPGRAGDSKLAKTKSGVPTINWKQLKSAKKIPRLDVGREDQITRGEFALKSVSWKLRNNSNVQPLPTPTKISSDESKKALATKVARVGAVKDLEGRIRPVGKPLSLEAVRGVQYTITEAKQEQPLPYAPLSDEEMKMVAALILFAQGNHCHMIMGLFEQLSEAPLTRVEALYHLGACADQLNMHQSAFNVLSQVITEKDQEFSPMALEQLVDGLPTVYEVPFYKKLKDWDWEKLLTEKSRDAAYYRMAKGAFRMGHFNRARKWSDTVSEKFAYHDDAQILNAMSAFARNDKKGALARLEMLWSSLEKRQSTDSNIRALTSVNLARMYFANEKYDSALEHYMKIPKDHPLWVQGLIEQGWTQLASEDFSGAIGNMYSLHSPYFKAVYKPESFAVRTIGYLNICQYGDAYKTLSWLESDYRKWFTQINQYMNTKPSAPQIYSSVAQYIRGKSTADLNGVAYQIWREMARRKDFLNLQSALNEKTDEVKRYEGVNSKIKDEKAGIRARAAQAKQRFDKWRLQYIAAKSKKTQASDLNNIAQGLQTERERTMGYRFKLALLETSRQGYLKFQKSSQAEIQKQSGILSAEAGQMLLGRAKGIQKELSRVLENNEFLRFEVFSGSGENIRYQVTGGKVGTPNRVPASIKPRKMMNWSFDGEFWEDEIGSYRSSLQNNCPDQPHATAQVGGDKE